MEGIEPRIQAKNEDMERRQKEIDKLDASKNQIEDKVFADFCRRVGIRHIREYEQRELRFHEEMQRKLGQCDVELDRLKNELEYLRSESKSGSVKREKEKIAALKKEQAKVQEKLDKEQETLANLEAGLEQLHEEVKVKKEEVEKAEAAVAAAKKESQGVERDTHTSEKRLAQLEQLETQRAQQRHSLLHECKMNAIDLPLISGSLDAIVLNDDLSALESQLPNSSSATTSTQGASYNGADEIEVDYSSLKHPEKKLKEESEVNKLVEKISKTVQEMEAALSKFSAPNMKADERMEVVKEKEAEAAEEAEAARKKARKARNQFEKVRNERIQRFNEFFQPVCEKIDEIYKASCDACRIYE
ncbi:SMC familyC-terminal domain containing protein [Aphelenchoides avenae]|nr:SMC familyC-terminal domain containing protein [Aphelenchus avenae]